MAMDVAFAADPPMLFIRFRAPFSSHQCLTLVKDLLLNAQFAATTAILVDLRHAKFTQGAEELWHTLLCALELGFFDDRTVAVLPSPEGHHSLARKVAPKAVMGGADARVCLTHNEALEWLASHAQSADTHRTPARTRQA